MVGVCSTYGSRKYFYRALMGIPEGKRTFRRPRSRWENNIKKDFQKVACGVMDLIVVLLDRDRWWALVNALMNFRVP